MVRRLSEKTGKSRERGNANQRVLVYFEDIDKTTPHCLGPQISIINHDVVATWLKHQISIISMVRKYKGCGETASVQSLRTFYPQRILM